ncbi:Hypothetical predicted protein [Cloeon dipterum]|uniref:Cullin family profile domain-containing protein n=1 Tax=Cloeon dipterum TaxID=197152 RepID=A0A8S1C8V6_9INSE|nr:Hypothetical predicted protein [Cloeon dipterum]
MASIPASQEGVFSSWSTMEKIVTNILSDRPRYEIYESAYYLVYRAVFFGQGQQLYELLEAEIANHLICQLQERLRHLEWLPVLTELTRMWISYKAAIKLITKVFSYFDKKFVPEAKLQNSEALGVSLFKDKVVLDAEMVRKLKSALALAVKHLRRGLDFDHSILKQCCELLIEVDMNQRSVYQSIFESDFLAKTREFYKMEAKLILQRNTCLGYVGKIENIIDKELTSCRSAMDPSTLPLLTDTLHEVLITDQLQNLINMEGSGVPEMLKNGEIKNLARIYRTLKKVTSGPQSLAACISTHLRERGSRIVNETETGATAGPTTHGNFAITYVQNLIELRETTEKYLKLSFDNNLFLKRSTNLDFEMFINSNPRSPEYLSLYIDDKLKRSNSIPHDQMEREMAKALVVFRFLREKDMFERYYKQHLAKRLLLKKAADDEWELNMVNKLKVECGFQFVQNLEGMFKDMAYSSALMDVFKSTSVKKANPISTGLARPQRSVLQSDTEKNKSDFDMDVKVLSPKNWPLNFPPPACTLPPFALQAFAKYEQFYLQRHQHRLLKINTLLGGADIIAHFNQHLSPEVDLRGPRKYYLSVSTQQMVILDLFNHLDSLSFTALMEKSGLSEEDLIKNLTPMVAGKANQQILLKAPADKNIQATDLFSVNESYHSKCLRVRLHPVASRVESVSERHKTRTAVEVDRKSELEAAVVRIMKEAKRLHQNALINKVIEQVKHRFAPTPGDIKKSIDALCLREFVGRTEEDRKMIEYKP